MANTLCKRSATVSFWDGYAPWYQLWLEHNSYHNRIIEALTAMVEPGWKALDIGAGSGILSLPLCAIGCEVTALEPSVGMRNLLFEQAFKRGIDWLSVKESRWEDTHSLNFRGYDLIMACNTLHLTEMGFEAALKKTFQAGTRNVFVITELCSPEIKISWPHDEYSIVFAKTYETESCFTYHHMDEVMKHHAFKKGGMLSQDEKVEIKSRLSFDDGHLCIRDNAHVGMYWWEREK